MTGSEASSQDSAGGAAPGEVVLYQRDDGAPALEVRLDGETVWVTQAQLAELF